MSDTVHLPPLPPLKRHTFAWHGADTLPTFAAYQQFRPYYAVTADCSYSDGRVGVIADTSEDRVPGTYTFGPPTPSQLRAYAWLKANEVSFHDAVVRFILAEYPALRELYVEADGDIHGDAMPPSITPADLPRLVSIGNVWLLPFERDAHAYLGLELGCAWDTEHGLGLVTHGPRTLALGTADTASSSDVPLDDRATALIR